MDEQSSSFPAPTFHSCDDIQIPVTQSSYSASPLKSRPRGRTVAGQNPTLSDLREVIGQDSPEAARKKYKPYMRRRPRKVAKDVFRVETHITTDLHEIILLATNNPSSLSGGELKNVQKFKISKAQHWTLGESLVAICYRLKNAPEEYDFKCIVLDKAAFLHVFFDTEELKRDMVEIAEELSSNWNDLNSSADMAEKRKEIERAILLDFRKNKYSKSATELVLAGTMFNFNLSAQKEFRDVFAIPKDVVFQLRMQDSETEKPKSGMAIFGLKEWISIMDHPDFKNFYQQIWNYLPLPQWYSTRIENYSNRARQTTETENKDDPGLQHNGSVSEL